MPCLNFKVVCYSLGNLISCLDDIIDLLQSDSPTSGHAINRDSRRYTICSRSVGMH